MARSDKNRHSRKSGSGSGRKTKQHNVKRTLGRVLTPSQVQWIERKIGEKGWNKEEFYRAYLAANQGKPLAVDPGRQFQRIFQRKNSLTPVVEANLAATLEIPLDEFEAQLKACDRPADTEEEKAAERHWQYLQNHLIARFELMILLRGPVGVDWFREMLRDTQLRFSRNRPPLRVAQLLSASPEPNTKESSPGMEQCVSSFWDLYEAENGYWVRRIDPHPNPHKITAGFDVAAGWGDLGVEEVERLRDFVMLSEFGISLPPRAFLVGVEEVIITFSGDGFSFEIALSEHGLPFMHEMASTQHATMNGDTEIPIGTMLSGIELLELFYRQSLPGNRKSGSKRRGITGIAGPGGKSISFYPGMPTGYMKTEDSRIYSFTVTVPKRIDRAREVVTLRESLKRDPTNAQLYCDLASIHFHEGRLGEALGCLESGVKQAHPDSRLLGMRGGLLCEIGRLDEGLVMFQRVLDEFPDADNRTKALTQDNIGSCLRALGRNEKALTHFQAAAVLEPSNQSFQLHLSSAFVALGRYSEAVGPAQRAIDLSPEDHRAAMQMGVLFVIQGNVSAAIPYFENAARLAPNSGDAHELLGQYLAVLGRHEAAVSTLKRAVEIKQSAKRLDLLGASLGDLDRWSEAEEAFRRADTLEPNNADRLTNLGAVAANQGRLSEALEFFRRAVSADQSNVRAAECFRQLRESLSLE